MKKQRDSRINAKLCWFSFPFLFGVNIANEILTFSLLNFAQKLFNFNISHSAFAFKLLMQTQKQVALQAQICRIQMLGDYRNRLSWRLNSKILHGNRLPSAFCLEARCHASQHYLHYQSKVSHQSVGVLCINWQVEQIPLVHSFTEK